MDKKILAGRVLSGLLASFLAFSAGLKLVGRPEAAETLTGLGWSADWVLTIGILEAVILVLYVVPATAVLGAVLMTGLLGAAIATHARVGSPLGTHILFGLYMALFAWGGLWLREPRLQSLLPLRRRP